ncbi:unnamed protein product [Polarella glacialis]|uniref:Uncharacterized protein n=1 Tax=Polarella glacialis TaxID=89957 RepID=A0A813KJL4_POLGL|nr:unnamed protein product [Polarella glacialis]
MCPHARSQRDLGSSGIHVFAETDVSFFPGWSSAFKECLETSDLCIGQQPGITMEAKKTLNIGVIVFRCTVQVSKFLHRFRKLLEGRVGRGVFGSDQTLFESELRSQEVFPWSVFSPRVLYTGTEPFSLGYLKVFHVAHSGSTLKTKTRALGKYRSMMALLRQANCHARPLHPFCCTAGVEVPSPVSLRRTFVASDFAELLEDSASYVDGYMAKDDVFFSLAISLYGDPTVPKVNQFEGRGLESGLRSLRIWPLRS